MIPANKARSYGKKRGLRGSVLRAFVRYVQARENGLSREAALYVSGKLRGKK